MAVYFNGTGNNYVATASAFENVNNPSDAALYGENAGTLGAWVRCDGYSSSVDSAVLGLSTDYAPSQFNWRIDTTGLWTGFIRAAHYGNQYDLQFGSFGADSQWRLLLLRAGNTRAEPVVCAENGTPTQIFSKYASREILKGYDPLRIGVATDGLDQFTGAVCQVFLTDTHVTDAQIEQLASGTTIDELVTPIHYYPLADPDDLADQGSQPVDLVVTGSPTQTNNPTVLAAGPPARLTLDDLADGQIIQRRGGAADVTLSGNRPTTDVVEARVLDESSATVVDWTALAGDQYAYEDTLPVPEGGWYTVQVRQGSEQANGVNQWGVGAIIAAIGQGNIEYWWSDTSTDPSLDITPNARISWIQNATWYDYPPTAHGAVAFANEFQNGLDTRVPVGLINRPAGGSALIAAAEDTANDDGYWLETGQGSAYNLFLADVAAVGGAIEQVLWMQGERDAKADIDTTTYRNGLGTLFTRIRNDVTNASSQPNLPITVGPLADGRDNGSGYPAHLWNTIRDAQIDAAQTLDDVALGPSLFDLPTLTSGDHKGHLTPEGYQAMGRRFARVMLDVAGAAAGYGNPQVSSIETVSSTQTRVNISPGGGNDFTPATDIAGIRALDVDDNSLNATADRESATTILLTHDVASGDRSVTVNYPPDNAPAPTGTQFLDNAPVSMGLQHYRSDAVSFTQPPAARFDKDSAVDVSKIDRANIGTFACRVSTPASNNYGTLFCVGQDLFTSAFLNDQGLRLSVGAALGGFDKDTKAVIAPLADGQVHDYRFVAGIDDNAYYYAAIYVDGSKQAEGTAPKTNANGVYCDAFDGHYGGINPNADYGVTVVSQDWQGTLASDLQYFPGVYLGPLTDKPRTGYGYDDPSTATFVDNIDATRLDRSAVGSFVCTIRIPSNPDDCTLFTVGDITGVAVTIQAGDVVWRVAAGNEQHAEVRLSGYADDVARRFIFEADPATRATVYVDGDKKASDTAAAASVWATEVDGRYGGVATGVGYAFDSPDRDFVGATVTDLAYYDRAPTLPGNRKQVALGLAWRSYWQVQQALAYAARNAAEATTEYASRTAVAGDTAFGVRADARQATGYALRAAQTQATAFATRQQASRASAWHSRGRRALDTAWAIRSSSRATIASAYAVRARQTQAGAYSVRARATTPAAYTSRTDQRLPIAYGLRVHAEAPLAYGGRTQARADTAWRARTELRLAYAYGSRTQQTQPLAYRIRLAGVNGYLTVDSITIIPALTAGVEIKPD